MQGTRTKKIKKVFIDRHSIVEADIESFPNVAKMEETITKDRILAKIKIIRANFRKAVDIGKRSGGGGVLLLHFTAYIKVSIRHENFPIVS